MSIQKYQKGLIYQDKGETEGLALNERYYNRLKHFDEWLAAHSKSYSEPAEDLERVYHKFFAKEDFALPETFDPSLDYRALACDISDPLWEMKHMESAFDNYALAQEYRWCLDDFNGEEDT